MIRFHPKVLLNCVPEIQLKQDIAYSEKMSMKEHQICEI